MFELPQIKEVECVNKAGMLMVIPRDAEVSYAYTRHQVETWDGHSDVKGAAVFEAPAPYFILFYVEHAQGNWFDVYWVNIRHRQTHTSRPEAPDP